MERSEVEAINRLVDERRRPMEPARPVISRPIGIMAIAGLQFLKAAVLLLTGTLLRFNPGLISGPDSPLYPLLYLATRGKYDAMNAALQGGNVLPGLLAFLGFYLGAIGVGLLFLSGWARRTLIFTSALTLALFARESFWPDHASPATSAAPDMTNFYILLAVDAGVFMYLLRGNTAELFVARQ